MRRSIVAMWGAAALVTLSASAAPAQTYDSGSTGADGAFTLPNATCPTSPTCTLDVPASGEFHFTTFTVPGGWTLKFKRNASNTPVLVRASGNVTVAGIIDVNGAIGANGTAGTTTLGNTGGVGGPGGFDGGSGSNGIVSSTGGTGGGPGGGTGGPVVSGTPRHGGGGGFGLPGGNAPSGGGVGGPAYGTTTLVPAIGGSGGGGGGADFGPGSGAGGGGGGGALVIASSGTVSVTGNIQARGGQAGWGNSGGHGGPGSGGAIRLAATTVAGNGSLDVSAGGSQGGGATASTGRIRVEAYNITAAYGLAGTKASVVTTPNAPTLPNAPSLRITTIAGVTTPAAPGGILARPDVVLPVTTTNPVQINVAAAQIPVGTTVLVTVRGQAGASTSVTSPALAGTLESSTTSVSMTLPTDQPSVVSASATFDRVAWGGGGPVYAEGERIDRVRVTSTFGGVALVTYITASGREISATQ